jgi:hypothetical protein
MVRQLREAQYIAYLVAALMVEHQKIECYFSFSSWSGYLVTTKLTNAAEDYADPAKKFLHDNWCLRRVPSVDM